MPVLRRRWAATAHLESRVAEQFLRFQIEPFEAGGGAPHLGPFIGGRLRDRLVLGRQEDGTEAIEERVLQGAVEARFWRFSRLPAARGGA